MSSRTYLHDNRWLTEVTVDANSTHSREATKDEIAEAENAPPAPPAADKSKPRTYQHDGKWLSEVRLDGTTTISRAASDDEIAAAKAEAAEPARKRKV